MKALSDQVKLSIHNFNTSLSTIEMGVSLMQSMFFGEQNKNGHVSIDDQQLNKLEKILSHIKECASDMRTEMANLKEKNQESS